MADEKDSSEKTEEPSQYKLEDMRKKGQVASSKELNSVLVLSVSVAVLVFSTVFVYETLEEYIYYLFSLKPEYINSADKIKEIFSKSATVFIKSCGPIYLTTLTIGVLAQILQVGLIYAPDVLNAKIDRINPINGFKRLFSIKALSETVKGLFKFSIIMSISYAFFKDHLIDFNGFLQNEFTTSFSYGKMLMLKIIFSIMGGMVIVAVMDFAWEKFNYRKKLMMSRQETKEEIKEKDGNPEVKQRIRTIQREISNKRMMKELPNADVVITNPTHVSVAIKYDSKKMVSPLVIAKGVDHVALLIRKIAKENDIPLVENIPLARSLNKHVEIGEAIPRNFYKAVAEILAFVYKLKRKRKALDSGIKNVEDRPRKLEKEQGQDNLSL